MAVVTVPQPLVQYAIPGGSDSGAGGDAFLVPVGVTGGALASSQETRVPMAHTGTVIGLVVINAEAMGTTASDVTLRKNGAGTPVTVNYPAATALGTVKTDLTNAFSFVAGDTLEVTVTLNAGASLKKMRWAILVRRDF